MAVVAAVATAPRWSTPDSHHAVKKHVNKLVTLRSQAPSPPKEQGARLVCFLHHLRKKEVLTNL